MSGTVCGDSRPSWYGPRMRHICKYLVIPPQGHSITLPRQAFVLSSVTDVSNHKAVCSCLLLYKVMSSLVASTERLQTSEKFRVNHPEIYGGSYSESGVQLLLSQARRWRKPINFVGDISRTSQPDFACHHRIARRPERVNTRY